VSARLVMIDRDRVTVVWPAVVYWIEAAAAHSHGWWTADDIKQRCVEGAGTLWVAMGDDGAVGAGVTEIREAPAMRVLMLTIAGGVPHEALQAWCNVADALKAWGRMHDCQRLVINGRPGFERAMSKVGFERQSVLMGMQL
jgi:hypothetical protein